MLEFALLLLLLLMGAMLLYRRTPSPEDYTILQRDYAHGGAYGDLLRERAPLVLRNVPYAWTQPWTTVRTARATWPVFAPSLPSGAPVRLSWTEWLHAPSSDPATLGAPMNVEDLARAAGLKAVARAAAEALRPRWSWLPGGAALGRVEARLARPDQVDGLRKTTAAATVVVATDGAPLRLWLCHAASAEAPGRLPSPPEGVDPWRLSAREAPWAVELKYVEAVLRPGTALVLPPHMYVAATTHSSTNETHETQAPEAVAARVHADGAWYYVFECHSAASYVASAVHRAARSAKR